MVPNQRYRARHSHPINGPSLLPHQVLARTSLTPRTARPIVDPFKAFSAADLDGFVGSITSKIKNALLGRPSSSTSGPAPPTQQTTDVFGEMQSIASPSQQPTRNQLAERPHASHSTFELHKATDAKQPALASEQAGEDEDVRVPSGDESGSEDLLDEPVAHAPTQASRSRSPSETDDLAPQSPHPHSASDLDKGSPAASPAVARPPAPSYAPAASSFAGQPRSGAPSFQMRPSTDAISISDSDDSGQPGDQDESADDESGEDEYDEEEEDEDQEEGLSRSVSPAAESTYTRSPGPPTADEARSAVPHHYTLSDDEDDDDDLDGTPLAEPDLIVPQLDGDGVESEDGHGGSSCISSPSPDRQEDQDDEHQQLSFNIHNNQPGRQASSVIDLSMDSSDDDNDEPTADAPTMSDAQTLSAPAPARGLARVGSFSACGTLMFRAPSEDPEDWAALVAPADASGTDHAPASAPPGVPAEEPAVLLVSCVPDSSAMSDGPAVALVQEGDVLAEPLLDHLDRMDREAGQADGQMVEDDTDLFEGDEDLAAHKLGEQARLRASSSSEDDDEVDQDEDELRTGRRSPVLADRSGEVTMEIPGLGMIGSCSSFGKNENGRDEKFKQLVWKAEYGILQGNDDQEQEQFDSRRFSCTTGVTTTSTIMVTNNNCTSNSDGSISSSIKVSKKNEVEGGVKVENRVGEEEEQEELKEQVQVFEQTTRTLRRTEAVVDCFIDPRIFPVGNLTRTGITRQPGLGEGERVHQGPVDEAGAVWGDVHSEAAVEQEHMLELDFRPFQHSDAPLSTHPSWTPALSAGSPTGPHNRHLLDSNLISRSATVQFSLPQSVPFQAISGFDDTLQSDSNELLDSSDKPDPLGLPTGAQSSGLSPRDREQDDYDMLASSSANGSDVGAEDGLDELQEVVGQTDELADKASDAHVPDQDLALGEPQVLKTDPASSPVSKLPPLKLTSEIASPTHQKSAELLSDSDAILDEFLHHHHDDEDDDELGEQNVAVDEHESAKVLRSDESSSVGNPPPHPKLTFEIDGLNKQKQGEMMSDSDAILEQFLHSGDDDETLDDKHGSVMVNLETAVVKGPSAPAVTFAVSPPIAFRKPSVSGHSDDGTDDGDQNVALPTRMTTRTSDSGREPQTPMASTTQGQRTPSESSERFMLRGPGSLVTWSAPSSVISSEASSTPASIAPPPPLPSASMGAPTEAVGLTNHMVRRSSIDSSTHAEPPSPSTSTRQRSAPITQEQVNTPGLPHIEETVELGTSPMSDLPNPLHSPPPMNNLLIPQCPHSIAAPQQSQSSSIVAQPPSPLFSNLVDLPQVSIGMAAHPLASSYTFPELALPDPAATPAPTSEQAIKLDDLPSACLLSHRTGSANSSMIGQAATSPGFVSARFADRTALTLGEEQEGVGGAEMAEQRSGEMNEKSAKDSTVVQPDGSAEEEQDDGPGPISEAHVQAADSGMPEESEQGGSAEGAKDERLQTENAVQVDGSREPDRTEVVVTMEDSATKAEGVLELEAARVSVDEDLAEQGQQSVDAERGLEPSESSVTGEKLSEPDVSGLGSPTKIPSQAQPTVEIIVEDTSSFPLVEPGERSSSVSPDAEASLVDSSTELAEAPASQTQPVRRNKRRRRTSGQKDPAYRLKAEEVEAEAREEKSREAELREILRRRRTSKEPTMASVSEESSSVPNSKKKPAAGKASQRTVATKRTGSVRRGRSSVPKQEAQSDLDPDSNLNSEVSEGESVETPSRARLPRAAKRSAAGSQRADVGQPAEQPPSSSHTTARSASPQPPPSTPTHLCMAEEASRTGSAVDPDEHLLSAGPRKRPRRSKLTGIAAGQSISSVSVVVPVSHRGLAGVRSPLGTDDSSISSRIKAELADKLAGLEEADHQQVLPKRRLHQHTSWSSVEAAEGGGKKAEGAEANGEGHGLRPTGTRANRRKSDLEGRQLPESQPPVTRSHCHFVRLKFGGAEEGAGARWTFLVPQCATGDEEVKQKMAEAGVWEEDEVTGSEQSRGVRVGQDGRRHAEERASGAGEVLVDQETMTELITIVGLALVQEGQVEVVLGGETSEAEVDEQQEAGGSEAGEEGTTRAPASVASVASARSQKRKAEVDGREAESPKAGKRRHLRSDGSNGTPLGP